MYKKTKLLIITSTIILFTTTTGNKAESASGIIEKDGYYLALDWSKNGNNLNVRGFIRNGAICKQMDLMIHLANKKNSGGVYIKRSINYHTTKGVKFKAKEPCYTNKKINNNNDWYINSLVINCKN